MILKKARVSNFRSVEDSGQFDLDDMTCLVGKNEAGKTAVLLALAGLNPHRLTPITFIRERDYPRRHLTEYSTRHGGKEAVVIDTWWTIGEDEKQVIASEFGDEAVIGDEIRVYRRYGDKSPQWEFPVNYQNAIAHLITAEGLTATERKQIGDPQVSKNLVTALEAVGERSARQESLLKRMNGYKDSSVLGYLTEEFEGALPGFMFFSHYDRMVGQIRLDNIEQRKADGENIGVGEHVFLDFLDYAGTSVKEIVSSTTYEGLNAKCEAASNRITDQLFEYWTQNPHLEIDVRVTKAEKGDPAPFNEGVIARARVKNNLHKVTVPFDERSQGFIWFFSFLVKFAQVQKSEGDVVLLLDEPGLSLHGKAQADLLRYFEEKLVPHHQVIFSTHSPFMVPADKILSARIVEDRLSSPKPNVWLSEGTKVRGDVLATDSDTLFPLQGALGYEVTQSLFIGKQTVLVEGPGDILYLQALSMALGRAGGTVLDKALVICPAGGLDKIQSFVSLFAGARLEIAALTDYATADRRKIENLRKSEVLSDKRLMTFAALLDRDEADVEDIFDVDLFLNIVNSAFELADGLKLNAARLDEVAPDEGRLVKRVEAAFRLMPPDTVEFDHFTPAEWLFRNPQILNGKSSAVRETLARAATVIEGVNAAFR